MFNLFDKIINFLKNFFTEILNKLFPKTNKVSEQTLPQSDVGETQETDKAGDSISPPSIDDIDQGRGKPPRPRPGKKGRRKSSAKRSAGFTEKIMSPLIELDLNERTVFIVFPEQNINLKSFSRDKLKYDLTLNGRKKEVEAEIGYKENWIIVKEERIKLEEPLHSYKVSYPKELKNKNYSYIHHDDSIYVFIPAGRNLNRMFALYNLNGNINPLPQKEIWVLLSENLNLDIEPDIVEDIWIWEKYKLMFINLKNVEKLIIRDKNTNDEKVLLCKDTFSISGEEVIYDDFGEQFPIFTGNSIEIKAPVENEKGWNVWIQNRHGDYKLVSNNWSGKELLKLKLPSELPCECGEFQLDICEQNGNSVETLFFRYIPSLQLNYPKELIIPVPDKGHKTETIELILPKHDDSEIKLIESSVEIKTTTQGFKIDLPPEEDTLHFSISIKDKPETKTNLKITVPRLKWKTSKQINWIDKPLHVKRDELIPGEDLYLCINPNSINKYDILAILESNDQKLQESKFVRKKEFYNLLLNQFYDTIKENKGRIILIIKIIREKDISNSIPVINFPEILIPESISPKLRMNIKPLAKCPKCPRGVRKGKGFSSQELIKAGIRTEDIKQFNLPLDKRRKSIHNQNIETLKSLIEGSKHASRSA